VRNPDIPSSSAACAVGSEVTLVAENIDIDAAGTAGVNAAWGARDCAGVVADGLHGEQGHDGTGRQQLYVLRVDLNEAQCVRTCNSSLRLFRLYAHVIV
jgi:hypothetical protein